MKRLLVTGARGFIGRHCLAPAIAAGFEVWAVASNDTLLSNDLSQLSVEWRTINLLENDSIEFLMKEIKPTHILHTAWETTHGSYWNSKKNLEWLALGARLMETFAEIGGQRFVAAGTCAEYDWTHDYMTEAETPERPSTFYGKIKLAHHQALMASAQHLNFSAATGRVFFAYGPYENLNRIIPYTCNQLINGEVANLGSGRHLRDFMHVEDVARGFIALLQSSVEGACNICSGTPSSLAEIVSIISNLSGKSEYVRIAGRPDREGDPLMLVGSNEKLISTGWVQKMALGTGLEQTFKWWKNNTNSY